MAELIANAAAEADVHGFSDRFLLSEWTNVVDAWGTVSYTHLTLPTSDLV